MFNTRVKLLIALVTGLAAGFGCGDEDPATADPNAAVSGDEASEATSRSRAPTPPPAKVVQRDRFVVETRQLFDDWLKREATFVTQHQTGFVQALGRLSWFKKLTTEAYEAGGFKPLFSDGTRLGANGDLLIETLNKVTDHGLDPMPYDLTALNDLVKRFSDSTLAYQRSLEMQGDEKRIWDFLMKLRPRMPLEDSALRAAAADAELSDDELRLLDLAKARLGEMFKAKATLNATLRDLDIALLNRWFRFAYDMRFSRRAHPFFADISDGAGVTRVADDLRALYKASDFTKMEALLKSLEPALEEYRATMQGLAQYRKFAAAGGQEDLEKGVERLKMKSTGPLVEKLQRRLALEDYYGGEIDGKYGPALVEAVKLYQETHQMKRQSGRVDRATRLSLNTSFEDRVKQVELSLRRYRESELHQGEWPFGSTEYRARVNIPEFLARFYRNGELARKHRVIVGNNEVEVDENTGKKGRFNHTRMFSAEMATVVLNPTWRVPRRIKEQELDLKLMDEPDFYETHNYEVKVLEDGTEMVVQQPGPNNALGVVKFLFPNRFAIYMHDTPKKRLFKKTYRAFSHGCMRTENPVDLARWILTEVNELTDKRFDKILGSRKEYGLALKKKIPVTIDYNSVAVHETGRMMFLTDVYRYDRDYFRGRTPYRPDNAFYMTVMVP